MQKSEISRTKLKKYTSRLPEELIVKDQVLNGNDDKSTNSISESELTPLIVLLHEIFIQNNS